MVRRRRPNHGGETAVVMTRGGEGCGKRALPTTYIRVESMDETGRSRGARGRRKKWRANRLLMYVKSKEDNRRNESGRAKGGHRGSRATKL